MKTYPIIFCLFFFFHPNFLSAQFAEIQQPTIPEPDIQIYIGPNGDDAQEGSADHPVATFQKAITLVPFDDQKDVFAEIIFLPGSYFPEAPLSQSISQFQSGNFHKNVSIVGQGSVHIYGDNMPANSHLIYLRGSGIRVENINIYNATGIGIFIANYNANGMLSQSNRIRNVLIKDVLVNTTFSHGILANLVDTISILNAEITRAAQENTDVNGFCQWGSALKTTYCRNVFVSDCKVYENRGEGIVISTSTNALVEKCVSYDNFAANIYCIRTNRAIFRNNLLYNRDSIFWRNCQANQMGIPQKRRPSNGFSIANEVNYDDFFSNACNPVRVYENGLFSNKLADSIFFYNNVLILAPLRITDESYGNCVFPQFSHANNFSNIFIENNTFIGDVSENNDYLNRESLITFTFDLVYFWGCFPNINGQGKFRLENIVFQNNIISQKPTYEGEEISPNSIFYGGRPCNGGLLQDYILSNNNLWHHELKPIYDSYIFSSIPNFMFGPDCSLNSGMLTDCEPTSEIMNLVPNKYNHLEKTSSYSDYITTDFSGAVRDPNKTGFTNVGAFEHENLVGNKVNSAFEKVFNLYPNPASDFIYIELLQHASHSISIYNSQGKKIDFKSTLLANNRYRVDLHHFSPGLYYALTSNGKDLSMLKFIKQ